MQDDSAVKQGQPSTLQSGPEVVTSFIEGLSNQADLDQGTVLVIAKLFNDKKLTVTNLVKSLEEARGATKV